MREGLSREQLKLVYKHVAKRYDQLHGFLTARSDARGRRMLVARAVRQGERVLDCGAGTGSTALLAAQAVGASGKVVLFDMSEEMLKVAKRKAGALGLSDRLQFQIGDILNLPFADGSFDVVLSTYSMCPLSHPGKGALEMYRVLRPGGRAGFAHSTEPPNRLLRWLADKVEALVWHFPSISMGCRSVSVLPALKEAGAEVKYQKLIGVPLWPFIVFVVEKPFA